jgi:hypothetical protein
MSNFRKRGLFFEKVITASVTPFASAHPRRTASVRFVDLELLQGFVLPTAATVADFSIFHNPSNPAAPTWRFKCDGAVAFPMRGCPRICGRACIFLLKGSRGRLSLRKHAASCRSRPNCIAGFRIVVVFDPTQGYTPSKLCRQIQYLEPGTGEIVKVHTVLCAGGKALTGLFGRVGDVTGPDDPQFSQLISQITTNLLPPFRPNRRGGRSGTFF